MNLNEFLQKEKELQEILSNKGKEFLQELFQPLFNTGLIREVRWHEYTPYFNDGEPCEFGVGEAIIIPVAPLVDVDEEDLYECPDLTSITIKKYEQDKKGAWISQAIPNPNYNEALVEPIAAFHKMWKDMPDKVFLATFGDHVEVHAKLEDNKVVFDVEEFNHD